MSGIWFLDEHDTSFAVFQKRITIGTRRQWKAFYGSARSVLADLLLDQASEKKIRKYYQQGFQKSVLIEGAYESEGFFSDLGENGKWIYFTAAPLRNSRGDVVGAIETLQDISDRKTAETKRFKTEQRYKNLLDFAPYPIVVFSLDGKVSYLNPRFTQVFGWHFNELEGKEIPFIPKALKIEQETCLKKLEEEKVLTRMETKRLTKEGRELDVAIQAAIYYGSEHKPVGYLALIRDISLQKRMEKKKSNHFKNQHGVAGISRFGRTDGLYQS